jgi:hypothetical protein
MRSNLAKAAKVAAATQSGVSGGTRTWRSGVGGAKVKWLKLLIVNDHARYSFLGSNAAKAATAAIVTQLSSMLAALTRDGGDGHARNSDSGGITLRLQLVGMVSFNNGDPWKEAMAAYGRKDVPPEKLLQNFNEWRVRVRDKAPTLPELPPPLYFLLCDSFYPPSGSLFISLIPVV